MKVTHRCGSEKGPRPWEKLIGSADISLSLPVLAPWGSVLFTWEFQLIVSIFFFYRMKNDHFEWWYFSSIKWFFFPFNWRCRHHFCIVQSPLLISHWMRVHEVKYWDIFKHRPRQFSSCASNKHVYTSFSENDYLFLDLFMQSISVFIV